LRRCCCLEKRGTLFSADGLLKRGTRQLMGC